MTEYRFQELKPKGENVNLFKKVEDSFYFTKVIDYEKLLDYSGLEFVEESGVIRRVNVPIVVSRHIEKGKKVAVKDRGIYQTLRSFPVGDVHNEIRVANVRVWRTDWPEKSLDFSLREDDLLIFPAEIVHKRTGGHGTSMPGLRYDENVFDLNDIPSSLTLNYFLVK